MNPIFFQPTSTESCSENDADPLPAAKAGSAPQSPAAPPPLTVSPDQIAGISSDSKISYQWPFQEPVDWRYLLYYIYKAYMILKFPLKLGDHLVKASDFTHVLTGMDKNGGFLVENDEN